MTSSTIWRKGRWFWHCSYNNGSTSWDDYVTCGGISRLTFSSEEEAQRAGASHSNKTGHLIACSQVGINRPRRTKSHK